MAQLCRQVLKPLKTLKTRPFQAPTVLVESLRTQPGRGAVHRAQRISLQGLQSRPIPSRRGPLMQI